MGAVLVLLAVATQAAAQPPRGRSFPLPAGGAVAIAPGFFFIGRDFSELSAALGVEGEVAYHGRRGVSGILGMHVGLHTSEAAAGGFFGGKDARTLFAAFAEARLTFRRRQAHTAPYLAMRGTLASVQAPNTIGPAPDGSGHGVGGRVGVVGGVSRRAHLDLALGYDHLWLGSDQASQFGLRVGFGYFP